MLVLLNAFFSLALCVSVILLVQIANSSESVLLQVEMYFSVCKSCYV